MGSNYPTSSSKCKTETFSFLEQHCLGFLAAACLYPPNILQNKLKMNQNGKVSCVCHKKFLKEKV